MEDSLKKVAKPPKAAKPLTANSHFVDARQLAERFSVSHMVIWRWARTDPTFPKSVKLSPGCTRWRVVDIEDWERKRSLAA